VTIDRLDREIEARLEERDVRYTKGRRAVIAALAGCAGPMSAAQLHSDIGSDVPLSSLYRSLTVLETAGVVVPHYGARGLTRYELAEWLKGHHHHLVCIVCGAVDDVAVPGTVEDRLREIVDEVGSLVSFNPLDHVLEIEGRCARCA
jgi:Fur family ferric uptake transcriptional regulator